MADLNVTAGEDGLPQRPTNDVPIQPRSTTRMLTDEGVKDAHVEAEPIESPIQAEPETPAGEVDPLDALLDEADAAEKAAAEKGAEEAPSSGDPTPPNFDAPEMAQFADQFKQLMGVDLKEAYTQFTSMAQQMAQQQQAIVEQAAQTSVRSLQEQWGVNDAEFNSRVEKVLAYTAKLPEATRQQFDSVEGINRIWARISSERPTPPPSSGGRPSGGSTSDGKTFRKSELRDMMLSNPRLYSSMQAAISAAYESGNVIDDI